MEVIKLELWQESAVFRIPYSMEVIETYPLPPYSTVLGFIHNVLDCTQTIENINLSIQGEFGGLIRDYAWFHKFNEKELNKGGDIKGTKYPIVISTLSDLHLLIHIKMPNEELHRNLFQSLKATKTFFHLGRREDLIIKIDVALTKVEDKEIPELLPFSAYIPLSLARDFGFSGIYYRIPSYYTLTALPSKQKKREQEGAQQKIRRFAWHEVIFVEKGGGPEKSFSLPTDEEGNPIWWMVPIR